MCIAFERYRLRLSLQEVQSLRPHRLAESLFGAIEERIQAIFVQADLETSLT